MFISLPFKDLWNTRDVNTLSDCFDRWVKLNTVLPVPYCFLFVYDITSLFGCWKFHSQIVNLLRSTCRFLIFKSRLRTHCIAELKVCMAWLWRPRQTYVSVCGRLRYVRTKYRPRYLSKRGENQPSELWWWYNVCSALALVLWNIPGQAVSL